jgi:DNA helicase-2/ATP-dependent DNA helicase PcrA
VARSGLIEALEAEHTDEARSRIENIREFFSVAQEFAETHTDEEDEDAEGERGEEGAGAGESRGAEAEARGAGGAEGTQASDGTNSDPGSSGDSDEPSDGSVAAQLIRFTEWLALRSDLDSLAAGEDYLTLMTVHSAKGLEFPIVFIAGLEESLFPHVASTEGPEGLEEERRLAYVAITRARELLYLTHTQIRRLFGNPQPNPRSRFVAEIPGELLEASGVGSAGYAGLGWEKRGDRRGIFGSGGLGAAPGRGEGRVFGSGSGSGGFDSAAAQQTDSLRAERAAAVFEVGDEIDHKTFGRGVVTSIEGDALNIRFTKTGETKKLLKGYAPIVRVSRQ